MTAFCCHDRRLVDKLRRGGLAIDVLLLDDDLLAHLTAAA